jgi:PHD/YefM family antitoxin component YafN of YafNO toxin-antitoxin module
MFKSAYITDVVGSLISITRFNRGGASKIFDEVHKDGTKIVLKNNQPACVLIDPVTYQSMLDFMEDCLLLVEAERRLSTNNSTNNISQEALMAKYGITPADLEKVEDVEIE